MAESLPLQRKSFLPPLLSCSSDVFWCFHRTHNQSVKISYTAIAFISAFLLSLSFSGLPNSVGVISLLVNVIPRNLFLRVIGLILSRVLNSRCCCRFNSDMCVQKCLAHSYRILIEEQGSLVCEDGQFYFQLHYHDDDPIAALKKAVAFQCLNHALNPAFK